jgi:predicted chitinase
MVTGAQLSRIMPHVSPTRLAQYFEPLTAAMAEFDITTPAREAAFLAQLAHESGELRYMEEIASGAAYEGRKDLGNTQPGDGRHYKGRGPIQLTGRANYRAAGEALGVDLETQPELAATPEVAFRVAGWFWKGHDLNEFADAGDFLAISRVINLGDAHSHHMPNGEEQREEYFARACEVLGA